MTEKKQTEKVEEKKTAETPKEKLKEVEKEIKKEIEKKIETPKKKEVREEKEFVIPLREKCRPTPRYKKAKKAIKTIKEFLVRHMKIYDRDLKKIKLDRYLNESVWARGIKKPPAKIKVKAYWEGEFVRVELVDVPNKLKFKKAREERREKKAIEVVGKKKISEQPKENKEEKNIEEKFEEIEKEKEVKEKRASVVEAGKQMEKSLAKQMKHQKGGKTRAKTKPIRVALEK